MKDECESQSRLLADRAIAPREMVRMSETVVPGLERRLRAERVGDVMFDRFARGRYATDASHYQVMPLGVVAPRNLGNANPATAIPRDEGRSATARAGGT